MYRKRKSTSKKILARKEKPKKQKQLMLSFDPRWKQQMDAAEVLLEASAAAGGSVC